MRNCYSAISALSNVIIKLFIVLVYAALVIDSLAALVEIIETGQDLIRTVTGDRKRHDHNRLLHPSTLC